MVLKVFECVCTYSVQYVYIIMHHIFHVILGLNYVYILSGVGMILAWEGMVKALPPYLSTDDRFDHDRSNRRWRHIQQLVHVLTHGDRPNQRRPHHNFN